MCKVVLNISYDAFVQLRSLSAEKAVISSDLEAAIKENQLWRQRNKQVSFLSLLFILYCTFNFIFNHFNHAPQL